jgi:hypothetical protein
MSIPSSEPTSPNLSDAFRNLDDQAQDYEALFTHPALRHVTCLRLDWILLAMPYIRTHT